MYEDYLGKCLVGIINAKQALKNHEETEIKDLKNTAAYNVQQALEFLVKYQIYNASGYLHGQNKIRQIYSHDLDMLIKNYCIPYGINAGTDTEKCQTNILMGSREQI